MSNQTTQNNDVLVGIVKAAKNVDWSEALDFSAFSSIDTLKPERTYADVHPMIAFALEGAYASDTFTLYAAPSEELALAFARDLKEAADLHSPRYGKSVRVEGKTVRFTVRDFPTDKDSKTAKAETLAEIQERNANGDS